MARPTIARVDLQALQHNFQLAQGLVPDGQCLAVVKANAYGHGAVAVAKVLDSMAAAFGVACIEEADELRQAGINKPVLLMGGVFNQQEVIHAAENNYWLMLNNQQQLDSVIDADLTQPVTVWLKVDSGMHRLGIGLGDVSTYYQQLQASDNVLDEIVIATHLACGDELDSTFTDQQIKQFMASVEDINAPLSISNSSGLLAWPQARQHWNRPGYMLYGNTPFSGAHQDADKLRHVMTLSSEIVAVRDIDVGETVGYSANWTAKRPSKIATIAVGYGDGYPRQARNGTPVIINGNRAPLVGRVSMDMITVDITDLADVAVGDEVVLWGEDLTANEVAECAGTIGYEVLTRMPLRVPRIYS